MFTLDQTVDPLRDFFWPFSFAKHRESQRNRVAVTVNSRLGSQAAAQSDSLSTFASVPTPILILLVRLISNAVMFSLVAGLPLLGFYMFKELSIPLPSLIKFLLQVILIVDLLFLLLSVAKVVIGTLRDI